MTTRTQQKPHMLLTKLKVVTRIGFVASSLMFSVAAWSAGKIYKIVDVDGNVSYTDVAPTDLESGTTNTTMDIEIGNTYRQDPARTATRQGATGEMVQGEDETESFSGYETLEISAPNANETLRANTGNLTLAVNVTPNLLSGHNVRFFLDGKPVGTVAGTSLALNNVDRGAHSVAAVVLDGQNKPVKSSGTVSFTLQRFAPKPAP